ncbi:YceI family protein, partial [Singulisphaera rosea]
GTVALGGGGNLVFDMPTFVADRPEARSHVGLSGAVSASDAQKTTATMQGKDVLNVARFSTAQYTFRSATPLGGQAVGAPGQYRLDGDFTLHGVTRPMPLTAVVEKTTTTGVLRMRCAFAIPQTNFGIRPYSAVGGLVGVNDALQVWGELIVRPAAATPSSTRAR